MTSTFSHRRFELATGRCRPAPRSSVCTAGLGSTPPGSPSTLAPLADVAQTIRYDQLGHGRSDRGRPPQWTLNGWADDLAEFTAVLGLAKPILLGTSFGAHVALACAARHPEQIGAVIAAYGGGRQDEDEVVEAFRRLGGDRTAEAAGRRLRRPSNRAADLAGSLLAIGEPQPGRGYSPGAHAGTVNPVPGGARGPRSDPIGTSSASPSGPCPLSGVGHRGAGSPLTPARALQELAEALTSSSRLRLVIVPNAGHTLFSDQPDTAYAVVRTFIARSSEMSE